MNKQAFLWTLPLLLTVAGCGGSSSTSFTPLSASAITANGLTARIAEPSARAVSGDTIVYTLSLTNTTSQPVAVETQGVAVSTTVAIADVPASLFIRDAAGSTVYPGSTPSNPPPPDFGPVTITLQPGETLTQQIPVDGLTAPGTYSATAAFIIDQSSVPIAQQTTTVGPVTISIP